MPLFKKIVPLFFFLWLLMEQPMLSAQSPATADEMFAAGKATAQQQNKKLLLVFSASWCGPCKLYARFLSDPKMKAITEKAFVVLHFDVDEVAGDKKHSDTPGAVALRSAMGAQESPGDPFIVIADAQGKPLINSYENGKAPQNIGYPVAANEIRWYHAMMQQTATQLSSQELESIDTWLQQHRP